MIITCVRCGAKQNLRLSLAAMYCPKCEKEVAEENRLKQEQSAEIEAREQQRLAGIQEFERRRRERLVDESRQVVLTTTHEIDGFTIKEYLGIESVEYVIGTGLFSEISTEIEDFFGQRSTAFETKLAAAKKWAMDALKFRAAEIGANAVVGVDLDYTEFSNNRVALIINGTLVSIVRNWGGSIGEHYEHELKSINQAPPSLSTRHADLGGRNAAIPAENAGITEADDEQRAAELFAQARTFANEGNPNEAVQILRTILQLFPNTEWAEKSRRTLEKSGRST